MLKACWLILKSFAGRVLLALLVIVCLVGAITAYRYACEQESQIQSLVWKENRLSQLKEQLARRKADLPSPYWHPIDHWVGLQEIEMREKVIAHLDASVRRSKNTLSTLYADFRANLAKAGWLIALVVALIFITPFLWKVFCFYGLAAWIGHAAGVRLPQSSVHRIRMRRFGHQIAFPLNSGETIFARMDWVKHRQGELVSATKLVWDWHSILVSFASELVELTQWRVAEAAPRAEIVLASPADADEQLAQIDLNGGAVVLRPRYVVAVTPGVQVRSYWRFHLHNFVSWRLRQIVFYGEGTLFVRGYGSVIAAESEHLPTRVEEGLLLGYETQLAYSVVRTETFWPFLRGKAELFDYNLQGDGVVLMQRGLAPEARRGNWFVNAIEVFLNGIGKFLGF